VINCIVGDIAMGYRFPPDLEKLVHDQMVAGCYPCEDDLLRDALRTLDEQRHAVIEEDPLVVEGIRRGLADMKAGRSVALADFDVQFRAQNGIPRDA
jgi:Arc/MetJ-type ribon-helix-helix transcriptional regulator